MKKRIQPHKLNYVKLKFPVNPLNSWVTKKVLEEMSFAETRQPDEIWVYDTPKEVFNLDFGYFMRHYGFRITRAHLFYLPPHGFQAAHVDGYQPDIKTPEEINDPSSFKFMGDYVKCNIIVGGAGAQMDWYEPIDKQGHTWDLPQENLEHLSKYMFFKPDQIKKVDTCTLEDKEIALVQVGRPHRVRAFNENRFCISLVFSDKKTLQRYTMAQTYYALKEFVCDDRLI